MPEVTIIMPDLAATDSFIKLVNWLVEIGQPIRRGESLCEVETDKAVMEVECVATGTLKATLVQPDEDVEVGQPIAIIEVKGSYTR